MSAEPSDSKLWAQAAHGDATAFGELYERHATAIYNHCFRRTASWSLAEDLTSAVFLQAWRHRSDVRFVGDSARPWLLGVATNLVRNQQRTLRRYQAALRRLSPPPDENDFVDDLAGRMDDERAVRKLLGLIERLPQRDREVLALCAWDGLSYAEAAVALGVPIGTVRSRLSRARGDWRGLTQSRVLWAATWWTKGRRGMKDDLNIPPARDLPPGHRRQRREHLLSELSRTEHESRRRPNVLLAVTAGVVVLVVAMVGVYAGWGWRILTPPETLGEGSSRWHFSDPKDMVATSDLVMLGTVTAVERDGVSDQGDVVYTTRLLHVTVDKRLFGTLSGDPVVVEDLGWEKAGGREMPWRVKGMIRLEIGDRAVLFLRKDPTTGRFGLLSDQAGYLVEGPDIADTARTDPMVRRIEKMSVSELERLIDEAAAAVRRGELQPIPEGGRRKPQSP